MTAPTELLIRVSSPADVETALAAGADRLGLTESVAAVDVADIVAALAGRRPLGGALSRTEQADSVVPAGVDWLEVLAGPHAADRLAAVHRAQPALRGVVVFAATHARAPDLAPYAGRGFDAALLTSGDGPPLRLLELLGIEGVARFVAAARQCGLQAWIGGDLEPPDIPRLLALAPHVLVACGRPTPGTATALDPARLATIRAMMPMTDGTTPEIASRDVLGGDAFSRDAFGRDGLDREALGAGDHVFVRDFVVTAGIGAYEYEHGTPQRLRFNVDADIARIPDGVTDVADIFSYDIIIDAIRLATRTHVQLVERLALDVAHATLRDHRVRRVRVRVEKLDILAGSVGVEVARSRTDLASVQPRAHVQRP